VWDTCKIIKEQIDNMWIFYSEQLSTRLFKARLRISSIFGFSLVAREVSFIRNIQVSSTPTSY
jgi:hypothetical protein